MAHGPRSQGWRRHKPASRTNDLTQLRLGHGQFSDLLAQLVELLLHSVDVLLQLFQLLLHAPHFAGVTNVVVPGTDSSVIDFPVGKLVTVMAFRTGTPPTVFKIPLA